MNRTLHESGRRMLFDVDMPATYWEEANTTVCYVQSHGPGKVHMSYGMERTLI